MARLSIEQNIQFISSKKDYRLQEIQEMGSVIEGNVFNDKEDQIKLYNLCNKEVNYWRKKSSTFTKISQNITLNSLRCEISEFLHFIDFRSFAIENFRNYSLMYPIFNPNELEIILVKIILKQQLEKNKKIQMMSCLMKFLESHIFEDLKDDDSFLTNHFSQNEKCKNFFRTHIFYLGNFRYNTSGEFSSNLLKSML